MTKYNKKGLIIILIIITILFVSAFILLNIQKTSDNKSERKKESESMNNTEHIYGNSQTNITNNGLISGDNEYIYYSGQIGLKYAIKKQNLQTGEVSVLITSNDSINYINLYNDDVYYLTDYSIYKISKNSEDRQMIIENVDTFTIVDDYIFYIQKKGSYNGKLCKLKIGETKSKEITSLNVKEFSIFGNSIAFTDNNDFKLYIVDLNGKNEKQICNDKVKNITKYGEYIFFNSNTTGTFCRINVDGTGLKDIMSNSQNKYLIHNNKIIIPNFSFVFYDLDGNELKKVKNEKSDTLYENSIFTDLGIVNNIIYYKKTSINSNEFELIEFID